MSHVQDIKTNCYDDAMQERVLGVADGTITDENEIEEVLHHLTVCDNCRNLYKDYFLIMGNDEIDVFDDTVTIDLQYQNEKFIPVSYTPYVVQQQVSVLADENIPVVEVEYPYNNQIIRIKIISSNKTVDISIYSPINGLKIYLLAGSTFDIVTVQNNTATFSMVMAGTIVLLFDLRKVVKINITV